MKGMSWMRVFAGVVLLLLAVAGRAQSAPAASPFSALSFLEGNWDAKTEGSSGVSAMGTYSFRLELGDHILARHSTSAGGCKGPATFDCEHGDLLYVYRDAGSPQLKAIYFDNEGHVIHYDVSTPTSTSVEFLSDRSQPGPQFRLRYELKGSVMAGKFQMRMPGQEEWKSYLEWSGGKHA